jgi:hypothetical protein
MRKRVVISLIIAVFLLLLLCACGGGNKQNEPSTPPPASPAQSETGLTPASTAQTEAPSAPQNNAPTQTGQLPGSTGSDAPVAASGEVVITFDYEKISGSASNQFAIWIEDMDGRSINTVFATRWTADGGYKTRPDSIAIWIEKSDFASMPDYYADAISGATPKAGMQSYSWNLKDINGETVLPGDYKFFVEGTLRWKNYVLYSGVITIGSASMTVPADAKYVYESSDRYAALTGESPENNMIGAVSASFIPAAS